MPKYRAEFSRKGPSVTIYADEDGTGDYNLEIAFLQGDEAIELVDRLDTTNETYTDQDVLAEYDTEARS